MEETSCLDDSQSSGTIRASYWVRIESGGDFAALLTNRTTLGPRRCRDPRGFHCYLRPTFASHHLGALHDSTSPRCGCAGASVAMAIGGSRAGRRAGARRPADARADLDVPAGDGLPDGDRCHGEVSADSAVVLDDRPPALSNPAQLHPRDGRRRFRRGDHGFDAGHRLHRGGHNSGGGLVHREDAGRNDAAAPQSRRDSQQDHRRRIDERPDPGGVRRTQSRRRSAICQRHV